jgi:UDP-N-acetylglucosamine 2-epimerase (non-hydrolysing)
VLDKEQPAAVVVVGDVNSTLACALVAVKKGVPVVHVEAGLRSRDRAMPEEINRILTDQISDLLFTTERDARANLLREGIGNDRIHFVGNVMIDTLHHNLKNAVPAARILKGRVPADWPSGSGYALLTLHRPSNVDDAPTFKALLEGIADLSRSLPVIFPVHPRTFARMHQYGLGRLLDIPSVRQIPPVGYLEMLGLMKDARMVLTDSGGIQEETTALGVPCITLRHNTERPITVEEGTNTLAGNDPARVLAVCDEILRNGGRAGRIPELWDGKASERIAEVMRVWLGNERYRVA